MNDMVDRELVISANASLVDLSDEIWVFGLLPTACWQRCAWEWHREKAYVFFLWERHMKKFRK